MNSQNNKMNTQHIDHNSLSGFARIPPADLAKANNEYNDLLDHLANCQDCREQLTAMRALYDNAAVINEQSTLTPEQHAMICQYIEGRLSAEDITTVKQLIENNTDAMKAALHYQCHAESLRTDLASDSSMAPTDNMNASSESMTLKSKLISLFEQLFVVDSPFAATIAVTATIFIALLMIINVTSFNTNQTMIASYQDDPTIQFTETSKLPGIGFFSGDSKTTKPFDNISIELVAENTIKISWPQVEDAIVYKMRIQVFNQGRKTVLKEKTTENNYATFKLDIDNKLTENDSTTDNATNGTNIHHNKRYEWILYGNTKNERMFYASGGFIIDKGY